MGIKGVFERLARGIKAVGGSVKAETGKDYALSEKYGYIHSCPTNLGTGMRASVHLTFLAGPRSLLTNLRLVVKNLPCSLVELVENLVGRLDVLMTSPTSIVLDTLRWSWSRS